MTPKATEIEVSEHSDYAYKFPEKSEIEKLGMMLQRKMEAAQLRKSKKKEGVRYFLDTAARKYCYTFPVIKGGKFLVRTTYYYRGFDSGTELPVFDQIVDGTEWGTVNTTVDYRNSMSSYYEIVVTAQAKTVSVCLARNKFTAADEIDQEIRRIVHFEIDQEIRRIVVGGNDRWQYVIRMVRVTPCAVVSSHYNIQVIVDAAVSPLGQLVPTGTYVHVEGELKVPPEGTKQRIELRVHKVHDVGTVDPTKYPLPKTRLALEFLRDYVHLCPRTNTVFVYLCVYVYYVQLHIYRFDSDE
ncbi:asparagine--tRNA ligase [Sarracenia purpurea var. burkii]